MIPIWESYITGRRFEAYFGVRIERFIDTTLSKCLKELIFRLDKFDDWLEEQWGEYSGDMLELVSRKYGEGAARFLERLAG